MVSRVATVIGGSGFVGRRVVRFLADQGYDVRVGTRNPAHTEKNSGGFGTGRIQPVFASLDQPDSLDEAFAGAEIGVNLVSILTPTPRMSLGRVNVDGAGACASAAANAGVGRYVHLSAIGADPQAPSQYGRSKAGGEEATRVFLPDAAILRPSVIFGPGDSFLTMFATIARFSPVLPVFCGKTRFQPVFVDDVARAVVKLATESTSGGRIVQAGGPDILSMTEIMRLVLQFTGRWRPLVQVPWALASVQASVLENLPGKLFTRDQLAMLSRDNIVSSDATSFAGLGIMPRSMAEIAPGYLA